MNLGKFDCSKGVSNTLYVKDDLKVRTAIEKDLPFIDKLQKENSYAVGFVPNSYFEKAVFQGIKNSILLICEKNDDLVGYVYITPGRGIHSYAKIQQIAVREDSRRLDYGSALLYVVKDFCNTFERIGVTLRCRVDLESNKFWKALGFSMYGVWAKGRINHSGFKASNDINLWRIDLNDKLLFLFDVNETENGLYVHNLVEANRGTL
jgi:GNAT superfamily N-acetyltransferase